MLTVSPDYTWRSMRVSALHDGFLAKATESLPITVLCSEPGERSEYDPARNPKLFREFVACDGTREGFLKFARKYGPLGIELQLESDDEGPPCVGEPYDLGGLSACWFSEWGALWRIAERWDALTRPRVCNHKL